MNPIIDGERWIVERLKFLREQLGGDLSADQRSAIEAEIQALIDERGLRAGGRRAGRFLRRRRRDP